MEGENGEDSYAEVVKGGTRGQGDEGTRRRVNK